MATIVDELEQYRRDLTGFCYRMLGSGADAEDAVQETLLKAWRSADRFEGRSSTRTWLYRIATNVGLDARRAASRRIRPVDLGPPSAPDESNLGPFDIDRPWLGPLPDALADPADAAVARDSLRLALVAALQLLPPKQRAALVLCEVLGWRAAEVAELLDTTTTSVNSALQRARAALGDAIEPPPAEPDDPELLARYMAAFSAYDLDALAAMLADDVVQSMPPWSMWLRGAPDVTAWMVLPGPSGCRGSRCVPTRANGRPAFAQYRIDPDGGFKAFAIVVLDVAGGSVCEITSFQDVTAIFPLFGLPLRVDAPDGELGVGRSPG